MLFDAFLRLNNSCIGVITNVFLPGRIVTIPHVIVTVVTLSGDVWIGSIIVNGTVSSVSDGIVTVGILSVDVHVMRLQLVIGVGRGGGHFHLPQRVLRVNATAVVRVRVTVVLQIAHVGPWK